MFSCVQNPEKRNFKANNSIFFLGFSARDFCRKCSVNLQVVCSSVRIWGHFWVLLCGKSLLFIILEYILPAIKRNVFRACVHVLALQQLYETVIQETAGGVFWSYFPLNPISRADFHLQCQFCKGRAEWTVCPMVTAYILRMENPGIR